jgi:hypothetical protein
MKASNFRLWPGRRLAGAVFLAMTLAVARLSTAAPALTDAGHGDRSGYHRGAGHRVPYGRHGDDHSGQRVTFLAPWMLRHGG